MPTTLTHVQLCIERFNAGDQAARDELIARACDRLRRLTEHIMQDFGRVRRWEDSDDVFQEAMVRLLRALEAVPITTAEQFFRLAALQIRRQLCDLVRKHFGPEGDGANLATNHEESMGPRTGAAAREPAQSTHDPGKLAFWTELHQMVERLPDEALAVVDLLWYQELTQDEAAGVLGVSVPTVKRRWAEARVRLGEYLRS